MTIAVYLDAKQQQYNNLFHFEISFFFFQELLNACRFAILPMFIATKALHISISMRHGDRHGWFCDVNVVMTSNQRDDVALALMRRGEMTKELEFKFTW